MNFTVCWTVGLLFQQNKAAKVGLWLKSATVISDIGEFFNVVQVNHSTETTLNPVAFFEAQNLNTKYTFLRLETS